MFEDMAGGKRTKKIRRMTKTRMIKTSGKKIENEDNDENEEECVYSVTYGKTRTRTGANEAR